MGIDVWRRRKNYAQPLVEGKLRACLRHIVSRTTVGTQVKDGSMRGGLAFLLSVLHTGCSSGLLCTFSPGYRCYRPHWMLALVQKNLPFCNCLHCLASCVRSLTCGHRGWAPTCFAHRGLVGLVCTSCCSWRLLKSSVIASAERPFDSPRRHAWLFNMWRPHRSLQVLHLEAVLQRD